MGGGGYLSDSTGTMTVMTVQELSRLYPDNRLRDGAVIDNGQVTRSLHFLYI